MAIPKRTARRRPARAPYVKVDEPLRVVALTVVTSLCVAVIGCSVFIALAMVAGGIDATFFPEDDGNVRVGDVLAHSLPFIVLISVVVATVPVERYVWRNIDWGETPPRRAVSVGAVLWLPICIGIAAVLFLSVQSNLVAATLSAIGALLVLGAIGSQALPRDLSGSSA